MKIKPVIKTYKLEGGSKVTIYKIFGNRYYFAVVDMNGDYPGKGKIAHNIGRNEFVLVLRGKIKVIKNGKKRSLIEGQTVFFEDGCKYEISGECKSLVYVDDGVSLKGESKIESKE